MQQRHLEDLNGDERYVLIGKVANLYDLYDGDISVHKMADELGESAQLIYEALEVILVARYPKKYS